MLNLLRLAAVVASLALLSAAACSKSSMQAAPDFSLRDLSGHNVHLTDYRGRLVLLNFWASWCAPCREEMPQFSQWQSSYGPRGLQVIGVSMDDDAKTAREFLKQHPVSYPIVMGDDKLGESFGGILGLPTTYLIDAQGRIVARYLGESNVKALGTRMRALLRP